MRRGIRRGRHHAVRRRAVPLAGWCYRPASLAARRAHDMSCPECNAIFHTFGYMNSMINALDEFKPAAQVEEWRGACVDHYEGMKVLMGHRLRAARQDSARVKTVEEMGLNCAAITVDYMAKWLPLERVERQANAIGKSGTGTHGMNVILKNLPPDLGAAVSNWSTLSSAQQQELREQIAAAGAFPAPPLPWLPLDCSCTPVDTTIPVTLPALCRQSSRPRLPHPEHHHPRLQRPPAGRLAHQRTHRGGSRGGARAGAVPPRRPFPDGQLQHLTLHTVHGSARR